jgi:hypothetical protein
MRETVVAKRGSVCAPSAQSLKARGVLSAVPQFKAGMPTARIVSGPVACNDHPMVSGEFELVLSIKVPSSAGTTSYPPKMFTAPEIDVSPGVADAMFWT